jgi:hypothetical protein
MYGSVDGGKTWEERKNGQRDENGVMLRNYYPYYSYGSQQEWYDEGTMLHIGIFPDYDTEQLVFNDEGKIDSENDVPAKPDIKHTNFPSH